MIKYLIIDDEYVAHGIIKRYCDLLPNMKLMKHCYDALEAFEYLNTHEVDLIFLDLNMPKLKGFDFLKTLSSPPKVIVTTAYKEYALEGYELNIVDYLLKPFGFERFLKAVNKAVTSTSKTTSSDNIQLKIKENSIFLKSNKKYTQVLLCNITYLESAGNYVKVITTNETITVREKITDLLAVMANDDFIQVHKSFAVAKKHIKSIEGNRILIADKIIPIGTMYKTNITQLLK
ncbi:two component transcriptional regulator, LytTR family [Aquimarina amphilecti]|uniref:Two component transcriptional regulator, LytTR family n=1 Tax=Aquimarina amphilecti TaxID=1038014 RepID=A0A1H7HHB7_AQUAM|nr:response regulator transcription factor [Aquimarina amphilecti]SEK49701.1 two component transcriptional regulator, LytTR family [Aquimarina amphilecti]